MLFMCVCWGVINTNFDGHIVKLTVLIRIASHQDAPQTQLGCLTLPQSEHNLMSQAAYLAKEQHGRLVLLHCLLQRVIRQRGSKSCLDLNHISWGQECKGSPGHMS